jgi:poly(beta-D-mannuronate) lyase
MTCSTRTFANFYQPTRKGIHSPETQRKNAMTYKSIVLILAAHFYSSLCFAQHVSNPTATLIDVPERQKFLSSTREPLLLNAIKSLRSCTGEPFVSPPIGRINIPHHYVQGSSGPINPDEATATRAYSSFEKRVAAGMNQYVATKNHAEAACALDQLDAWAKAGALLNYDRNESSQAWYQVEWTSGSAAVSLSVLTSDADLDSTQIKRVKEWLLTVVLKNVSFEKPRELHNNHHYWRAMAAAAIGVVASDDFLFKYAISGVPTFLIGERADLTRNPCLNPLRVV